MACVGSGGWREVCKDLEKSLPTETFSRPVGLKDGFRIAGGWIDFLTRLWIAPDGRKTNRPEKDEPLESWWLTSGSNHTSALCLGVMAGR
jgi:hypothetical protein